MSNQYTEILIKTCEKGNPENLGTLIEKGADVNVADANGSTSLTIASMFGFTDIARLLIDHGAQVNTKNKNGNTPLLYACARGHLGIARLLMARGADVDEAVL